MSDNITAAAARALPCCYPAGATCDEWVKDNPLRAPYRCAACACRPAVEAEMRALVADVFGEVALVLEQLAEHPGANNQLSEAMRQVARKWGVE